jgi:hypothetical protein
MTRDEIEAWAAAYIELLREPGKYDARHPLSWAVSRFQERGGDVSPDDCWAAILEIVARDPSDESVAILAAGPLEDLINHHGPEFIDRIELESRRNPAFRHLLGGVWRASTPEVWARIEKARGKLW